MEQSAEAVQQADQMLKKRCDLEQQYEELARKFGQLEADYAKLNEQHKQKCTSESRLLSE
jgi:hypothetical protein